MSDSDNRIAISEQAFSELTQEIRQCRICANALPNSPRPVFQAGQKSKIVIIGQAPGTQAHLSETPWNDKSGDRLRDWMGVSRDTFYDTGFISLVPMGFCYPGKGKSGDLPPRPECAPTWHEKLLCGISPALIMLVGQYAQQYYLGDKRTLTARVRDWQTYLPEFFVLPHPSPRNNIWLKKHSWFESDVLPDLRKRVNTVLC